jgi:hypothetical protein
MVSLNTGAEKSPLTFSKTINEPQSALTGTLAMILPILASLFEFVDRLDVIYITLVRLKTLG